MTTETTFNRTIAVAREGKRDILVELFIRAAGHVPHGFEATTADTTNEGGYFRQGGLEWELDRTGVAILTGYDGVEVLPAVIGAALKAYDPSIRFDEFVFDADQLAFIGHCTTAEAR